MSAELVSQLRESASSAPRLDNQKAGICMVGPQLLRSAARRIEALQQQVDELHGAIAELECEVEWCGKSPNAGDRGLCSICLIKELAAQEDKS